MPGFHTIHSNRVELLCEQLIRQQFAPQSHLHHSSLHPFAKEFVLVDNRVLGSWLNIQIAQQETANYIAANIEYIQPHQLFWRLARQVLGAQAVPKQTPLSKEEMTWKLYGLLGDDKLLSSPALKPVAEYLGARDKHRDLKRYQLSASIADLFDQYQVYRPQWMCAWPDKNFCKETYDQENEAWQQILWEQLADGGQHRAAIELKLLKALEQAKPKLFLDRLFVFGMTTMPPGLVQMLVLLSQHIDVYLYVMNPCEQYWSLIRNARELARRGKQELDDEHYEIGNPLLATQGVQVRDFIGLLQDAGDDAFDALFPAKQVADANNLLEAIQLEIQHLVYKEDGKDKRPLPIAEQDTKNTIPSVHIHNCHSIMREVEVLHDQLRDMMARSQCTAAPIFPRDIVVMMPKVAPYVGAIHAVFNSVGAEHKIAYHITDRTQAEESPLLNSIATLLQLPDSRLPLSEVVLLLEVPALRKRFGLDETGYELLKRWLVDSGVRWGLDAQHRKQLNLPAYAEASWQFALDRLLAGYAMQASDHTLELHGLPILPYDLVEGGNSAALDSFLRFWDSLQRWRQQLATGCQAAGWATRLRNLVDDFFLASDEDEHSALKAAWAGIKVFDDVHSHAWCQEQIPLGVVRKVMQPVSQQTAASQNPWQEGVKFCSLLPMRGVPFKVVYILGMNMGDYPRHVDKHGFDLMRSHRKPGDRASRTDDRWLFLEALLSARQYFHVSYIGKDIHRNEKREPSVVLSELVDYCMQGYDIDAAQLITEHPLQPFSDEYFRADGKKNLRLVSFNQEALTIAHARHSPQVAAASVGNAQSHNRWEARRIRNDLDLPAEKIHETSMEDFIRFFTRPPDWFFTRKHSVRLKLQEDEVLDEENLAAPDGLGQWQLRDALIKMVNAGSEPASEEQLKRYVDTLVAKEKAKGRWPLGLVGDEAHKKLLGMAPDYLWASQGAIAKVPCDIPVETAWGKLVIKAEFNMHGDVLLHHTASNNKEEHQLAFYIRALLAYNQFEHMTEARAIFYKDKAGGETLSLPKQLVAENSVSQETLKTLATLYFQYHATGLPFAPELSHEIADLPDDSDDKMRTIEAAWNDEPNDFSSGGFKFDITQRSYFGHIDALFDPAFEAVSRAVWGSLELWLAPQREQMPMDAGKQGKKPGKKK